MNTVDFCFWLQGYFEISESKEISEKQVEIIKNHLNLVFKHEIDPVRESESNADKAVLDLTHAGPGINDTLVRC